MERVRSGGTADGLAADAVGVERRSSRADKNGSEHSVRISWTERMKAYEAEQRDAVSAEDESDGATKDFRGSAGFGWMADRVVPKVARFMRGAGEADAAGGDAFAGR